MANHHFEGKERNLEYKAMTCHILVLLAKNTSNVLNLDPSTDPVINAWMCCPPLQWQLWNMEYGKSVYYNWYSDRRLIWHQYHLDSNSISFSHTILTLTPSQTSHCYCVSLSLLKCIHYMITLNSLQNFMCCGYPLKLPHWSQLQ